MKKILAFTALLSISATAFAQTNWTAKDCNGNSHTLQDDVDSGKVVVMIWVMPCDYCTFGAKASYNAAQSYTMSNPGKVKYYLIDDYGDNSCANLSDWIKNKNIGTGITMFDNDGKTIDMDNFDGPGMPRVTVIAGSDRKIYYNKTNAATNDEAGIKQAISSAIGSLGVKDVAQKTMFTLSPNPVANKLSITAANGIRQVVITTLSGQVVQQQTFTTDKNSQVISTSDLATGTYIISVKDKNGSQSLTFKKQ